MYTVFQDEDGREYRLTTTMNDFVGRKAVLSTTTISAYRNGVEFSKPCDFPSRLLFYLPPPVMILSMIYYITKAFRVGLKGDRAQ